MKYLKPPLNMGINNIIIKKIMLSNTTIIIGIFIRRLTLNGAFSKSLILLNFADNNVLKRRRFSKSISVKDVLNIIINTFKVNPVTKKEMMVIKIAEFRNL